MDIALVIFWLFAGVSILYVVHFGLYLVGANFYDVWQQRRKGMTSVRLPVQYEAECAATATWTRRALPEVPGLVSIAIAAHNEESVIVRTLDSIRRSTYRSFEVLIADDASTRPHRPAGPRLPGASPRDGPAHRADAQERRQRRGAQLGASPARARPVRDDARRRLGHRAGRHHECAVLLRRPVRGRCRRQRADHGGDDRRSASCSGSST